MAKTPTDIRSLARVHTNSAIRTLACIMAQPDAPHSARVAAAQVLLDRGWGKAPQTVNQNIVRIDPDKLSDAELADLAVGSGESAVEAESDQTQLH